VRVRDAPDLKVFIIALDRKVSVLSAAAPPLLARSAPHSRRPKEYLMRTAIYGRPDGSATPAARIGVLDPLTGAERISDVSRLNLPLPTTLRDEELSQAADAWLKRFQDGAVARGATKPVNLVGTLSYKAIPNTP
jgi:hypothetical protein